MSLCLPWFDSDTLRHKLLVWVMVPMVILLILNILFANKFGHDSADRRHDRFLFDASKILLDQVRTNQGNVEFSLHSGAINMLTADKKDQVYFFLSGWQQNYHFGYADLPRPREALTDKPVYYLGVYNGRPVRMMAALMPENDVVSGRIVVLLGKTLAVHDERAEELMWRLLPAQFVLIFFVGVAVWWGVGRGMRPLLQLREEVSRRSSQDLSPLQENRVVAEVRPLIAGFNDLLGRLDQSMALQRRFVSDAAHQLRTPIAGLKAQTELALRSNDPNEIRYSLQLMHRATEHAAHLVNQLLALARAEPGVQQPEHLMPALDFVALARTITEECVGRALQKEIDLGFEAPAGAILVNGDAFLLREMLNNLIDNALRYTPSGGQVTVRVTRAEDVAQLEVEDNGPGIPDEERERVFERFYSVLGTNQGGCGLGLSIVSEIVQRHQAQILLSSGAEGVGTMMRVIFRAA
ncbi:MAG: sensor histidine kinase N-terminal domain-containing protein [Gallionella sp.]|nr:sensor histidine kinase N-terminal domain-containing protein [Gallionella sp.]